MRFRTVLTVAAVLVGCGTASTVSRPPPDEPPPDGPPPAARADEPPGPCARLVERGLDHLEAGDARAAEAAFGQAARADRACAAAWLNLAVVQRRAGRLDRALVNVRRALAVDARSVHGFHQLVLVHLARAEADVSALRQAELACRQGLQVDDAYAPLHNTCGIVDVDRGRIVDALARFERAFTLDPELFEAWMNFGQITLSFRGYADAERAFRAALEARPDDYDGLIGLGIALRGLRRHAEARASYERARSVDPARPEAWYNLGILYQDHLDGSPDQLARATEYLEEFVAKAEGDPEYADAVQDVVRCCPVPHHGRPSRGCRPGRLQNLRRAMHALGGGAGDPPGC